MIWYDTIRYNTIQYSTKQFNTLSCDVILHYNDVIMGAIASWITSLTIVYWTVYSDADQRISKLRATGLHAGNSPGTSEFPAQMASNAENASIWWGHHVCNIIRHDMRLNKRLSKQSWGWWFKTLSRPLWRHCNVMLHNNVLYCIVLYRIISYHTTPYHTISYHIISYHIISHHISYRIVSSII